MEGLTFQLSNPHQNLPASFSVSLALKKLFRVFCPDRVCCYYLQEGWVVRHLLDVELQLPRFECQFCHLLALCLLHVMVSLYVRWYDVGFDIS